MIPRSLLLVPALLAATPAAADHLTLDRLFASPALSGPVPRLPKLSPDGKLVALLKNRPDDSTRYDLWAIDTATGQARMLVDSLKIGSGGPISEEEKMHRERLRIGGTKGITDYDWAPDGKSLLVPIDGDLYLATLDGHVRRLTNTSQTELDAKVSEDGRFVSFVRDQNLYDLDLASGKETKLSPDGGGTVNWGTAEFVAQEEMDRETGHWWAPGDKRLAVERFDEANVKQVARAAIGAEGTQVFEQRYPAAGTPNVAVALYLMNPDGSGRTKVDLGSDPDIYLARVDWAPDGSVLYVQRENRDQKTLDMLKVDPATGRASLLFTEHAKAWINLNDGFHALKDGSMIWLSERSGYAQVYRFKGGRWTALTSGPWVVSAIAGIDEAKGRVYFTANKETPIEQQLYWTDIKGGGAIHRLTEAGWTNSVKMDKAGSHAIIARSNPSHPPQVYLADADGKQIAWIEANQLAAGHPYYPFLANHRAAKFGTLAAADGSTLHWEMITPPLVPGKRYPVFFQHYGGPGSQTVTDGWVSPIAQYLVSRGWIFFQIDNRGSPNRGTAFEDQIYHAMGTVEVDDQVMAARWLKTQGFVDPAKIVTFGWSYGGYMTLKMLEKAPGVFAAGIAVAPVTKWQLYDTHYTERYLGNPAVDPKPYDSSNALPFASAIKDPLLMVHGMADDNVVFENSTAFYAALQNAKVPFEMMVYPGKAHALSGPETQTHVWDTIETFADKAVGIAPPPRP